MSTLTTSLPLRERIGKVLEELSAASPSVRLQAEVSPPKVASKLTVQPDWVLRSGDRIFLIEVTTTARDLPLPSSANAQMLILKAAFSEAAEGGFGAKEIVPVLVTNYMVDESDRADLGREGIKLISVDESKSDNETLRKELSSIIADH